MVMVWKTVANLLEATDGKTPTVQGKMICGAVENYRDEGNYHQM